MNIDKDDALRTIYLLANLFKDAFYLGLDFWLRN